MRQELQESAFCFLSQYSTQGRRPRTRTVLHQSERSAACCWMCSEAHLFPCAHLRYRML